MKNMRVPRVSKGWIFVGTNALELDNVESKQDRIHRERKFNKLIDNTEVNRMDEEETKKYHEELFQIKNAAENQLITALDSKLLKSEKLIKKAEKLKKKREKERISKSGVDIAEVIATAT